MSKFDIKELIKIPFYRLFLPITVSILAIFLYDYYSIYRVENLFGFLGKVQLLQNLFLISLLFIIGEIFCFVGELIINILFHYFPFKLKIMHSSRKFGIFMEKITPIPFFRKGNSLSYSDFVNAVGKEVAMEISEVHFVLSRTFAGLLAASITVFFVLVFRGKVDILIFFLLFFTLLGAIYYRSHANCLIKSM